MPSLRRGAASFSLSTRLRLAELVLLACRVDNTGNNLAKSGSAPIAQIDRKRRIKKWARSGIRAGIQGQRQEMLLGALQKASETVNVR